MSVLDRVLNDAPNLLPRAVGAMPRILARHLKRPVFLIGCGRSGKTVLAGALGRHPDIALFPGEANSLWHPRLYPWRESPVRAQVPPIWVDPEEFASGSLANRTQEDLEVLKACFGTYQALRRRPILLNESALIAVLVPFILEAFERPFLIHFVRDGRAVAPAWAKRQHATIVSAPDAYRAEGLYLTYDDVLDRCATSWSWQVREVRRLKAGEHIPEDSFIEFRYEDFCRSPLGVLESLCAALSIDPDPLLSLDLDYIENQNAIDARTLTAAQRERITALTAPALQAFGYEGNGL